MELSNQKPFPKPDAGVFLGTIIDVVDLPNYPTAFGPKNKVRILWVLGKTDNTPALDPEGKPFQVIAMPNASMNEKATLFKMLTQILGQAPPLLTTSEQLSQLLLNRSNQLFLTKTPNPQKPGDFFVNVTGIMPLAPGQIAPVAPVGFVRAKDKPKIPSGATTQAINPQANTQAVPANNVAF
jgi:hypothetical protein